jgi:hypothetical protein
MPFDPLGRQIDTTPTREQLLAPVSTPVPYNPANPDPEDSLFDKVVDVFKEFGSKIEKSIQSAKDMFDLVLKTNEDIKNKRTERREETKTFKGGIPNFDFEDPLDNQTEDLKDSIEDNLEMMNKLAAAGLHKGSIYSNDTHAYGQRRGMINQSNVMIELLVALNKNIAASSGRPLPEIMVEESDNFGNIKTNKKSMDQMITDSQSDQKQDIGDAELRRKQRHDSELWGHESSEALMIKMARRVKESPLRAFTHGTEFVSNAALHSGGKDGTSPMDQGLFGGIRGIASDMNDTNIYQKEIAEVAYITEGITKELTKQQAMYRANAETADISISSGIDKKSIEAQYLKLLKSGYKTQKDTLAITRTSAHLATNIGASFEEAASFAEELHMDLGLSADSVENIAQGLKQTARYSHLTGSELMNAAKAAKPVMEAMKRWE